MAGKTITGTVNKTVTLGSAGYLSPLTITGEISSSTAGAIGIYLPNQPTLATIVNHGKVYGATGSIYNFAGSAGGAAIVLDSGVSLINTNGIGGGNGGSTDTGGNGGDGIDANANVTIVNSGLITGGGSAYGRYGTGYGGNGVSLATSATLTNSGNIDGGAGGSSYHYVSGTGKGGVGVISSQEAVITNTGNITGGAGGLIGYGTTITGGDGGDAMYISNGTTLTNGGHITGGQGGGATNAYIGGNGYNGIYLGASTVTNTGTIAGGLGGQGKEGGSGGAGVFAENYALLSNKGVIFGGAGGIGAANGGSAGSGQNGVIMGGYSTVNNTGHITGGAGGSQNFLYASGGNGNSGVYMASGLLTNSGTISGGAGGFAFGDGPNSVTNTIGVDTGFGGAGIYMSNRFSGAARLSVVNYGLIQGGNGGYLGGYGGVARGGGDGVDVVGGTLTNKGAIIGGTGGDTGQNAADYGNGGIAGAGGSGAFVYVGARLINTGKITGGTGGATIFGGTIGGAGVEIKGGTLVTSGTITGGAGGVSQDTGAQGDAVYVYGTHAGTLIINPGAVFHGSVVAVPTVENVLEFAGSSAGTVQGIGTEFTGFYEISFASGATRAIEGTVSAMRYVTGFAPHDSIILDNYTDNLAATEVSPSLIGLSTSGTTAYIYLQPGQANNFIITDAGSKTTIAPVFGTFSHTLATGMEQYVLSGSTSTSLLKTGGVEEVYSSGIASKTTISGGELELQIGAKLASGVTFGTGGGELKLDSSVMPTATITGFIAGDTIDLAGIVYNKYDTVTVGTAGIVSVVTPGKTYNLDIAGATVGEKDFIFAAGSLLTKKAAAAPKMQFIAPGSNGQVSSYWLGAPMDVTAPVAAEPPEPVAAFTTISAPSTGVAFTDLRDSILHVSLASWIPHG